MWSSSSPFEYTVTANSRHCTSIKHTWGEKLTNVCVVYNVHLWFCREIVCSHFKIFGSGQEAKHSFTFHCFWQSDAATEWFDEVYVDGFASSQEVSIRYMQTKTCPPNHSRNKLKIKMLTKNGEPSHAYPSKESDPMAEVSSGDL